MIQPVSITVQKTARYFILSPKSFEEVKSVVFVLHGYAQAASEFLTQFESISGDAVAIIAPEGLHRFYARGGAGNVVASWMTKEDRENDIRDYISFLDEMRTAVIAKYPNLEKEFVLGFSQGGATASRWVCAGNFNPDRLILWCAFFPPDVKVHLNENVAITIVTASNDRFFSNEEAASQIQLMRASHPKLLHVHFEGEHEIHTATLQDIFSKLMVP
jgi:predicted esterase